MMPAPVTYVPVESTADELFTEHIDAGVGVEQWDTVPVKRVGPGIDRVPVLECVNQSSQSIKSINQVNQSNRLQVVRAGAV